MDLLFHSAICCAISGGSQLPIRQRRNLKTLCERRRRDQRREDREREEGRGHRDEEGREEGKEKTERGKKEEDIEMRKEEKRERNPFFSGFKHRNDRYLTNFFCLQLIEYFHVIVTFVCECALISIQI